MLPRSSRLRISEILGEPQASLERLLRETIAPEGSKKQVEAISAEKTQKAGNTYYDTWKSLKLVISALETRNPGWENG